MKTAQVSAKRIEKTEKIADNTRFGEAPWLLIKGFLMGTADVIPGVSGGTMALILGIYSRLIHAIKSFDLQALFDFFKLNFKSVASRVHWRFLLFVVGGDALALLFFTRVLSLPNLMYKYPEPIYGLFFGLILGSIWMLLGDIYDFGWKHTVGVIIGLVIGYWVVTLVPVSTPDSYPFVFFSGAIAICAMILPGISGSFLLLILRKYTYILTQISHIGGPQTGTAFMILGVFIIGMITGITLFSRLLSWLLDRYYTITLSALVGFLLGSLYVIWPFQLRHYTMTVNIRHEPVQSEEVQDLLINPPDTHSLEYSILGNVINPKAPYAKQQVLIRDVKRKLIHSEPYYPDVGNLSHDNRLSDGALSFWLAIVGVVLGLVSVPAIEKLAEKGQT